jgi:hypothetical protein
MTANLTLTPTLTDRATDILTLASGTFMAIVSMGAVSVALTTLF